MNIVKNRNGSTLIFPCQLQHLRIAGAQKRLLVCLPAPPDRADRMDDVTAGQLIPFRDDRFPGLAVSDPGAFFI